MHQLRARWLALFGGILLLTLSVSTAFGARPEGTEANRGSSVSAFVHSLVFGGTLDPDDDGDETDTEEDEDGDADENEDQDDTDTDEDEESDEEATEDESEADEDGVEVESEDANAHGKCVSAVARDKEAVGGPNENHGGAVSEAARETCRTDGTDDATEGEEDSSATDGDESDADADDTDAEATEASTADRHGPDKVKPDKAKANRGQGHGRGKGRS